MKDVKYMIFETSMYDYSLIEEKLMELAAQGWHLEKVGSLAWKFRRGEPKAVRYAVTYAPSASAFNSQPTEAEEDLSDLCAQAGWVRAANYAQVHIYRNENPNATPLETDEAEKLRNIQKTMKKHFFPTEALMITVFLMQFFMHFHTTRQYPGRTLSSPMMLSTLVMCLFVALIHVAMAIDGILWLRRAQRAVESGETVPSNRFYRSFRWVIWIFLGAYLLCLLWAVGGEFLAIVLGISAAVLLVTVGGVNLCKKLNAPKWVNMVVPAGLCSLVVAVLMPILVMNMSEIRQGEDLPQAEHLPLQLSHLTGETDTDRFILEEYSSILASYGRYWDNGADEARLNYTIVDVKCPLVYDMLLNEQEAQLLNAVDYVIYDYTTVSELEALFDAEYVRHAPNALGDRWLICWEDRIVNLRASWELTADQLAQIKAVLMP